MTRIWKYIYIIALLIVVIIGLAIFQLPDGNFNLIACNVGQGDATLLIYKNLQILVDGGPDGKVMNCLGKYLPFWDRELELVILTHPDSDHFRGLIDVFKNYKVDNYLANEIAISKPEYQLLKNAVGGSGTRVVVPHNGQELRLDLIHIDTLAPMENQKIVDNKFSDNVVVSDAETNAFSIVSLVSFKNFRAVLTGDMTLEVSDSLAKKWTGGSVEYIKIPHHGSKNGVTENFLRVFEPKFAVISVGKNLYGHPSEEVLSMLKNLGIKYLRTDKVGNIEVVGDGNKFWIK